jgi:hypothetical protein
MNATLIRAKVKPECVPELEAAVEKAYAAIAEAGPAGVHYSSARLTDGVTFVALLALEDEDAENPLASVLAFVEFQQGLARWLDGPPEVDRMAVLGSYRVF